MRLPSTWRSSVLALFAIASAALISSCGNSSSGGTNDVAAAGGASAMAGKSASAGKAGTSGESAGASGSGGHQATGGKGTAGASGSAAGASAMAGQSAAGQSGTAGTTASAGMSGGLGAATFAPGELDAPSLGGTITFQEIGATGWYPSIRDPASGMCDAYQTSTCCLTKEQVTTDALTPWDQDLIMTLRGPMRVKQYATYQPSNGDGGDWSLVSSWDDRAPTEELGLVFHTDGNDVTGISAGVGTECLVDVSEDKTFACGAGSSPYCAAEPAGKSAHYGWSGSKMFVLLATMDHASAAGAPAACSKDATGNWYDAPWIGLSLGELVRAGAFSSCQCYAKDPTKGYLGDGCGQFNVFETVNDNGSSQNFDVFSTSLFGYAGYVGDGPCGPACDVSKLAGTVDLIDTKTHAAATAGALANPMKGPAAAFRRPEAGYRYFVILLDVATRTIQLALVHPSQIPSALSTLLPALPGSVPQTAIDAALGMRLPE